MLKLNRFYDVDKYQIGYDNAKESTVYLAMLARDIEGNCEYLESLINQLQSIFDELHVFIYENDSKDNTVYHLENMAGQFNNDVWLQSEKLNAENSANNSNMSRKDRLDKFVEYRNILLDNFKEDNETLQCDYFAVLDSDIRYVSIDGILDSFYKKDLWDVVTSNGIALLNNRPIYYDISALVIGDVLMNGNIIPPFNGQELIDVDCAFGGLAFYKSSFIDKNSSYGYKPIIDNCNNCRLPAEHYSFCRGIKEKGGMVVINPNQVTYAWNN